MSKTTTALLGKFVVTFIVAAVAFGLMTRSTWGWIFLVAIVATIVNYAVGDLMVLPAAGNLVASLGDGLMGGIVAYVINLATPKFNTNIWSLLTFAVLVAVFEYFFHQYLLSSDKVEP